MWRTSVHLLLVILKSEKLTPYDVIRVTVGSSGFVAWPKRQTILFSSAWIWIILLLICILQVPQINGSAHGVLRPHPFYSPFSLMWAI